MNGRNRRTQAPGRSGKERESAARQALGHALSLSLRILKLLLAGALVLYLGSGIFTVPQGSVALVTVGGAFVRAPDGSVRIYSPGVHFTVPPPLGKVHRIRLRQVRSFETKEFWFEEKAQERLAALRWRGKVRPLVPGRDGYLLCGDGSILHARFRVDYVVQDAPRYLQAFGGDGAREEELLRLIVASAAVKQALGIEILSYGRTNLGALAKRIAEDVRVDFAACGLHLRGVAPLEYRPPLQVSKAFLRRQNASTNALAERQNALRRREALRNEARMRAGALVAEARVEASKLKGRIESLVREAERLGPLAKADPWLKKRLVLQALKEIIQKSTVHLIPAGGKREVRVRLLPPSIQGGGTEKQSEEGKK